MGLLHLIFLIGKINSSVKLKVYYGLILPAKVEVKANRCSSLNRSSLLQVRLRQRDKIAAYDKCVIPLSLKAKPYGMKTKHYIGADHILFLQWDQ